MEAETARKIVKLSTPKIGGGGVGKILDDIVKSALEKKASDIHMEHTETDMIVRFRVDGILREYYLIEEANKESLIFKVKVAAKLRTDEHFAPQDGRIKFTVDDVSVDTRVSILPTSKGEKIVMRLLTSEGKDFSLENLGLEGEDLEQVERGYTRPYGTLLVCGPTGSGKTTTLYSMLKILNTKEKNITTIEDPVEYDIEGINHVQINAKANMTFANGLRSILRQDPDIVMIGEIRDSETARIAINTAMTGHLVLSTLHTNDAVTSIPRLLDMGIEGYLIASTINVVISQRLGRKLCEKCKSKTTFSGSKRAEIQKIRPDIAEMIKAGATIYEAAGCKECDQSGYKGRIGLFEVLSITDDIREAIISEGDSKSILKIAFRDGFKLLVEDGAEKVKKGVLSIEELIRVTSIKD